MKVASFDARYRLTVPAGLVVRDAQRGIDIDAALEFVRPQSALYAANLVAGRLPDLKFTVEVCRASGQARWDWHPIWHSPAAREQPHKLWTRLARAVEAFRL